MPVRATRKEKHLDFPFGIFRELRIAFCTLTRWLTATHIHSVLDLPGLPRDRPQPRRTYKSGTKPNGMEGVETRAQDVHICGHLVGCMAL